MQECSHAARRAHLVLALLTAASLSSACGGGLDPQVGIADDSAADGTQNGNGEMAAAERVKRATAPELLRNGVFAQGLTSWSVDDAVLVASQLRSGGKALNVGWRASQTLGATTLVNRQAYSLFVKARNEKLTGTSEIVVRFRRPSGSEAFRTYKLTVASNVYRDYQLDFTAPEFVGMADVCIVANGTRVIVDSVTLKARPAIAQTEPITSPLGSHVPPGYRLAFNDEFRGAALNRKKWATRYIYGAETQDRLNDEQQRYRDNDNHRVAGGVLSLLARRVSTDDPNGIDYESGMIRSLWTSRYGYYETRVKMPGGVGVWAGFWLNSDVSAEGRLGWPPEIDIAEFVNNGVEDTPNMLHSNVKRTAGATSALTYADPAFNTTWTSYAAPFNFHEGWHTIGAQWDEGSVSMYVDGRKIYTRGYTWTYGDNTLAGPAHILLNLAIGGAWAGRHGIDDSAYPQALQVDWVRAYEKVD